MDNTLHRDQDVVAAFNRAADDIIAEADLPDEGVRDALNLLVNAGLRYLREDTGTTTLQDVVESDVYEEGTTLDDVIDWINRAN